MIRKIKWNNHTVLENLELNLCRSNGEEYNTIILAGENGTGKTTILEGIQQFLKCEENKFIEYVEYSIGKNQYKFINDSENGLFHKRIKNNSTEESVETNRHYNFDKLLNDKEDIRSYGILYSKANTGFITSSISTISNLHVDTQKIEDDEEVDYTQIKQLLIDLSVQDSLEWTEISKIKENVSYEDYLERTRISRFRNAFNNFFESLKFKRVDSGRVTFDITFEKNGKEIKIDDLSTGELQIVYRGAYLLRNCKNVYGGVVLIDEPELSMHPKWQMKILNYYRDLFTENGVQKVQMIFATHSEYILKEAVKDSDNVLILILKDNAGKITAESVENSDIVLPSITAAEINYLIFDILSIDYHIELYGYLQSKYNKNYIIECDDFIFNHRLFDSNKHYKIRQYNNTIYKTLPTFIRNAIDHPNSGCVYTEEELRESIKLLRDLCR